MTIEELTHKLSHRQLEIVWTKIHSKTYADVAETLNAAEQTIKNEMTIIRDVVGARNNEHLVWLLKDELERRFNSQQTVEYTINDPNASWNLPK